MSDDDTIGELAEQAKGAGEIEWRGFRLRYIGEVQLTTPQLGTRDLPPGSSLWVLP
jgi:hypothetical protein